MSDLSARQTIGRRSALSLITLPCLKTALTGNACAGQSSTETGPVDADPVVISNDCIDWQLTTSLDVAVLINGPARDLIVEKDRARSVQLCLRMLENEHQFVVGHVILCSLFNLVNPCLRISGAKASVRLFGLEVEVEYSSGGVSHKRISYPQTLDQQASLNLIWEPLRGRQSIAQFAKFHHAVHATPLAFQQISSSQKPPDNLNELVHQTILAGVEWRPVRLGTPAPFFPNDMIQLLSPHKEQAARECLRYLMEDDNWIIAHLLLSQLMGTDTAYVAQSRPDGTDLEIDGLSIQSEIVGTSREAPYTYPHATLEKHMLRHRWRVRAMIGKWD